MKLCVVVILCLVLLAESKDAFKKKKCNRMSRKLQKQCIKKGFELSIVECEVDKIVDGNLSAKKLRKCKKVEKNLKKRCIDKGYEMKCYVKPEPVPVVEEVAPVEANECPATHPYAYYNGGQYCCASSKEKVYTPQGAQCDGGDISTSSMCCAGDSYTKCPHGECVNYQAEEEVEANECQQGLVALRNPAQSSTFSNSAGEFPASNAIDGSGPTYSKTDRADTTGQHWLTVSMDLGTVDAVTVYGMTFDHNTGKFGVSPMKVALYKGDTLVGTCEDHPGKGKETLRCDAVEADMVKISLNEDNAFLAVREVEVIGAAITGAQCDEEEEVVVATNVCPATHPYAYYNGGQYCCASSKEKVYTPQGAQCDGGDISTTSMCCAGDSYTKCPHGECVNHA